MADGRQNEGAARPSSPTATPRYRARDLLKGHAEITLELDGRDYRLRLTSAGKLILTK